MGSRRPGSDAANLRTTAEDGIPIEAIYWPSDDPLVFTHRPDWTMVERIDTTDIDAADAIIGNVSFSGNICASLVFSGGPNAHGFGLPVAKQDVRRLFDQLAPTIPALRMEPHPLGLQVTRSLATSLKGTTPPPIRFGLDPIGNFARWGFADDNWQNQAADLSAAVGDLRDGGFAGPFLEADGRVYHDAGATECQELAVILATAVAYVEALCGAGDKPEAALNAIGVTLSVPCDQPIAMAKIRAARLLWIRLAEACGIEAARCHLHGESSWRMMAREGSYTNIIRATIAALAAGVAGAESLSILPFSIRNGLPDAFARRIARNIHHLLMEEANVHASADPVAGSGASDALTRSMAETAWSQFQDIQREGGIVASLMAGQMQGCIAQAVDRRRSAVRDGTLKIVGVTDFHAPEPVDGHVTLAARWPDPRADAPAVFCTPLLPTADDDLLVAEAAHAS